MEHWCGDCKHDGNNTCEFTGAVHTTKIECPSFGQKENRMFEVSDKVRVVADKERLIDCYLNGTLMGVEGVIIKIVPYPNDSKLPYLIKTDKNTFCLAAQDLELVEAPTEAGHATTSVGHPEGVSELAENSEYYGQLAEEKKDASVMESYTKGATRTACETKIDPEGFFSPLVILRYSEYMHKCRVQADGTLRDSDNWQGGIPPWRYMKGKWRHFLDTWLMHRGYKKVTDEGLDIQDCLCAELFNTMGYLHVVLCKEKGFEKATDVPTPGGAHKNFKDRTAPTEGDE